MLKFFALISMVIDHYSYLFLNHHSFYYILCRNIGRFAFVMFGIILAYNYIYFTHSKKKFIIRLFIFGLISQIPFMLVTNLNLLNIFFTYLLAILIYESFTHRYYDYLLIFFVISFFVDYYIMGVLLVFLFILYFDLKKSIIIFFISIFIFLINPFKEFLVANFVNLLIVLYFLKNGFKKRKVFVFEKYFFYLFYPLHLLLLFFIVNYSSFNNKWF